MPNIKRIIKGYNHKVLKPKLPNKTATCNCRKSDDSTINGQCLSNNTVYKAMLKLRYSASWIILTRLNTFKQKWHNNVLTSFRLKKCCKSTALSLTVSLTILEVVVKILVLVITSLFSNFVDRALGWVGLWILCFYCYKFVCCQWCLIFFSDM